MLPRCILSKFYIKPQHARLFELSGFCCILSKFYIKPQQRIRHKIGHSCCILSKFYIKPQHSRRHVSRCWCCILSKFYIKPQHERPSSVAFSGCILSKFYIKPQHWSDYWRPRSSCILSKFYIKPQPVRFRICLFGVVSYRNSTSNHNSVEFFDNTLVVVSYRNSTSNHNSCPKTSSYEELYLIEILHQTTTEESRYLLAEPLYLIEILHQTTTAPTAVFFLFRLYLIEILHQTTTSSGVSVNSLGCILSKFYIKPQPTSKRLSQLRVVSYRNSTSNHNGFVWLTKATQLYLIEILHQTTTATFAWFFVFSCILSKFYIKPQLVDNSL